MNKRQKKKSKKDKRISIHQTLKILDTYNHIKLDEKLYQSIMKICQQKGVWPNLFINECLSEQIRRHELSEWVFEEGLRRAKNGEME